MPAKNGTAQGSQGGGTRLVIVESPAKAKTIAGYLGGNFVVESSIGHIRDLPGKASEVPTRYKGEEWAKLGVNVDRDFEPLYIVNADKKQQVAKLKKLLEDADELFLATDEDREGEAIAWHLQEVLKPKVPVHRMVFNEITRDAIRAAAANPRQLNLKLVDAQETRRILDRLYGYEVSPVLWKKMMMPGLSAGRVQSVATRLVVERERERIAFVPGHYWDISADFDTGRTDTDDATTFTGKLVTVDGKRIAQGRDFTAQGVLQGDVRHLDEEQARGLAERLEGRPYAVKSVERKPYTRKPYAPFRTTTLQQEASRKLGFSSKYTMQVAQKLYENGFITYMRTDSITLSETAITAARAQAATLYGNQYIPDKPRVYAGKVKNAQEAHEAIRPAGDTFRTPGETGLSGDQFKLYELIWKRTVASQMKDAAGESVSVRVAGVSTQNEAVEFGASGKTITFYGFLKAYVEGSDDPNDQDDKESRLPNLAEDDPLTALSIEAEGHSTRPPARYTEASLIKELEDREIGRPSTYASIIGTILDRGYVFKKGTALVPSFLAFAVNQLLEKHFGNLVDYEFTARMEDCLDAIARGETERVPWLRRFYFGADDDEGLKEMVGDLGEIDAKEISSFPLKGSDDIMIRVGRYGPYLDRDGERVNLPEDLAPDELDVAKAEELFAQPSGDRELGKDPESGHVIVAKSGRFGPYVTELLPEEPEGEKKTRKKTAAKPRTASLFKSMSLDTVTLDDALKLLSLPRTLGEIDGEPVTAQNGRFGPYVKKGTDSRSLAAEEDLFTVTLEQAKELLAQPKQRGRGRAAAAPPLRTLGDDPASGKPVVVKEGRFGPYVTDGETNASLRKGDEVESITIQRAAELLAERREKVAATGGPKKRSTPRTTTKRSTAKSRS